MFAAALAAGATAALPVALTPTTARAGGKFSQKMAKYQPGPKGPQDCANCSQFQPADACKIVDGTVSSQGWCQLYSPKK
jgi:hypothetical protein